MKTFDENNFLAVIENDRSLACELIDLYLNDSPGILIELDFAVNKGDSFSIEKLAHRLKGNLKIFYATQAVLHAANLEEMGRLNDLKKAPVELKELHKVLLTMDEEVKKFKSDLRTHA